MTTPTALRRRGIRLRTTRVRTDRSAREQADRHCLRTASGAPGLSRGALWRRVWGTCAGVAGAALTATALTALYRTRLAPGVPTGLSLAVLAVGVHGLCAAVVLIRTARGELPRSLSQGGLLTWYAMVCAILAVVCGDLRGGPPTVAAVWLALVAAGAALIARRRER
ncbi:MULTISPECIES: hypothetical protein [unclassified Streptomyces]|uniref:hypothetical protein n=1 Tax=unclassified Streptomyces TaxID=2593676 RepID=UPI0036F55D24